MEILSADSFSNEVHRILAEKIYENYKKDIVSEPAMLLNMFDEENAKKASEVFYNMEIYEDDEKTFEDLIMTIKKERIKKQIMEEKNPEKLRELLNEQAMLSKK